MKAQLKNIRFNLTENRLSKVYEEMLPLVENTILEGQLISLKAQHNEAEKAYLSLSIVDRKDYLPEINKIKLGFYQLLDELRRTYKLQQQEETREYKYNQAYIQIDKGEYEQAILLFEKVLFEDPKNPGAYTGRGLAKTALNRWAEAELDYDFAILSNPNYVYAYINRSSLYALTGRITMANQDEAKVKELGFQDLMNLIS